jgi:multidrug resistance protein
MKRNLEMTETWSIGMARMIPRILTTGMPLGNRLRRNKTYRWCVTAQVAVLTLCVAFTSSVFTAGIPAIAEELHTSNLVATMGVTTYVLGFAFGPLVWAPLSEARGRRPVYFISWTIFTVFQIPCALAKNPATLIVARLIAGTFGSSPLANAGGSLADIWLPDQRGKAMSLFAAAPFLGPVLGPVVGGFLTEYVSWRWTFWLSFIYACVMLINLYFIPETYGKAILGAKARKLRKETGNHNLYAPGERNKPTMYQLYKVSLLRPWLMFCEPIVLLFSIYVSLLYGILYLLFVAFPIIFEQQRGWGPGIGGLAFVGIGVGSTIGVALTPITNRNYLSQMKKHANGKTIWPEARLPPTFIGAFLMPISLFWFAWTSYPTLPWISTILAGVPFGLAQILLFLSIMNYIADCYLQYAASALAANSLLRSVLGATFPLWAS